ncbi:MAG: YkgJ family cysteine cluster protein, partial [Desulfobacteraceae bacterium]
MAQAGKTAAIVPERLGPKTRFKFRCDKEVPCFTKCCKGTDILLTPYDIVRLKKRLGLSSEEFLALYTDPRLLEKTDLPVIVLKKMEAQEEACPFVREDGCIIYTDRPTACRYYPLGVASLSYREDVDGKDFFFFVHEPH